MQVINVKHRNNSGFDVGPNNEVYSPKNSPPPVHLRQTPEQVPILQPWGSRDNCTRSCPACILSSQVTLNCRLSCIVIRICRIDPLPRSSSPLSIYFIQIIGVHLAVLNWQKKQLSAMFSGQSWIVSELNEKLLADKNQKAEEEHQQSGWRIRKLRVDIWYSAWCGSWASKITCRSIWEA